MARASQVGQASTACPTCGLTANSTTSGVLTQLAVRSAGNSPGGSHWKLLDRQESELNYVDHKKH
jgi:hypothetical protein